MYLTLSSVSLALLRFPGRLQGTPMRTPFSSPNAQVFPRSTMPTVPWETPNIRAILFCVVLPSNPSSFMRFTCAWVNLEFPLTSPYKRPFTDEYWTFSLRVAQCKLSTMLLARLKSRWLTSDISPFGGGPMWAIATNLCTYLFRIFPADHKDTCEYPDLLGYRDRMRPWWDLLPTPRGAGPILSNERTRPWSDTSYSPSYPTTGSHFSSISNLSPGLMPSLRSQKKHCAHPHHLRVRSPAHTVSSGSSRIPPQLCESIQPRPRLSSRPRHEVAPVAEQVSSIAF